METKQKCPKCGMIGTLRFYQTTVEEWDFTIDKHNKIYLTELIDSNVDGEREPNICCLACMNEFDVSDILDD